MAIQKGIWVGTSRLGYYCTHRRKVSFSGLVGQNWFVNNWNEACSRHGSVNCEVWKPFSDHSLVPLSPTKSHHQVPTGPISWANPSGLEPKE